MITPPNPNYVFGPIKKRDTILSFLFLCFFCLFLFVLSSRPSLTVVASIFRVLKTLLFWRKFRFKFRYKFSIQNFLFNIPIQNSNSKLNSKIQFKIPFKNTIQNSKSKFQSKFQFNIPIQNSNLTFQFKIPI